MQADMEEAKTKENAKLQSALEEMQLQLQGASKGAEQVSVVQEVSVVDREMINKLTAENEQLKVKVLKLLYAYVAPEYLQIDNWLFNIEVRYRLLVFTFVFYKFELAAIFCRLC